MVITFWILESKWASLQHICGSESAWVSTSSSIWDVEISCLRSRSGARKWFGLWHPWSRFWKRSWPWVWSWSYRDIKGIACSIGKSRIWHLHLLSLKLSFHTLLVLALLTCTANQVWVLWLFLIVNNHGLDVWKHVCSFAETFVLLSSLLDCTHLLVTGLH